MKVSESHVVDAALEWLVGLGFAVLMVTGTSKSHQRVSPKAPTEQEALSADLAIFAAFEALVGALVDRRLANRREARALAQTRDPLLPTLLSGEIPLAEAEKAVEAVA